MVSTCYDIHKRLMICLFLLILVIQVTELFCILVYLITYKGHLLQLFRYYLFHDYKDRLFRLADATLLLGLIIHGEYRLVLEFFGH